MPRGQHVRVVKPRCAAQKANIAIHRRFQFAPPMPVPPPTSWWVGVSREELQQRAVENRARIAMSKFGRLQGSPNQGE